MNQINGYEITTSRITEEPAKGQWRAQINGKTVAVSRSKSAVINNAEFLARAMTPQMFRALVSPIGEAAA